MASNKTPLLENGKGGSGEEKKKGWEKVVDFEEAKMQICFSVPMILTSVSYYCITLISVMFAGHLGDLELAASTLANSWVMGTGLALMTGLSGALETLCGQGFLQTQTVIIPLVVCSVVPLVVHVGITYTMISHTPLGFRAAPLAASISLWISFLMLALYVNYADKFKHTWEGFSMECFRYVLPSLKLAIPSAVMVCLEYWAFEYLVLIAGLMPTSERSTSLIAMCVNTEAVTYMITYGFSAAVSTRVSNELGAGNANRAKNAIAVTLKLSIFLALTVILALAFGHNIWASSFTNSPIIKREFASMTPLLAISILFDSAQGILSGVSRGCGWQHLAAWTNLAAFYGIGMPIAVLLGFKMGLYAKGLWIGLICGLSCQACTLLVITVRTKWEKINLSIENGKAQSVLV
ncbi:protein DETOXIFICATION 19-like isoform X2 [Macadamia integrifolia]|uniref:protein DETOXIFICATION 19-like isoform X2 n=1 Tax=Macadamia integrifolia TaxID=60698 RepID=UPI001C4E41B9|nr:protein DETOXIFICATION 19-like isoform X2 [Macadamia integrifolia]